VRVLVTGGAGFIGSQVVSALVAAGHEIRVLDALLTKVHPPGWWPAHRDGVEFRHGQVADPEVIASALHGVDAVCHQAAMVGRGREILEAARYVTNNDLATATLLTAMARDGIERLVLASSVVIYGDSRYDCPVHHRVRPARRTAADLAAGRFEPLCPTCGAPVQASAVEEDDPLDPPRNVYAVSKLTQEHLVESWVRETGGQAVALRYHNVYGPGMPYDSPYSGVASTFRSAVARGKAPEVFEDGRPRRDFVHVRDVASANLAALGWTGGGFRAFNVASGDPRSIGELATTLATAAGALPPVVTGAYRVGDVRHIFASPSRIIAELNWRPEVDFSTGIAEFATAPMRGYHPDPAPIAG
jgi:dTDP-L-rhamnose 4-epimerase